MKTVIKIPKLAVLLLLISFSMAACSDEVTGENSPYLGNTLTISNQQLWKHNPEAKKLSESFFRYDGADYDVYAWAIESQTSVFSKPLGSGKIENGILHYDIPLIDTEYLLDMEDLIDIIFSEWKEKAVESLSANVKASHVIFFNEDNIHLNREKLYASPISLGMESTLYVYTDNDCKVTGNENEGYLNGMNFFYTESKLNLHFKKGWNTVCRRQAYGKSGQEALLVTIKNLDDSRWVIYNN